MESLQKRLANAKPIDKDVIQKINRTLKSNSEKESREIQRRLNESRSIVESSRITM